MSDFEVEYINSNSTFTDITEYVPELGKTAYFSDGRISTSRITLQAEFGWFVTESNGGKTPIISPLDRIRISHIDSKQNTKKHIFEVTQILPSIDNTGSDILLLTLEGRERNLSLIPFSGYFDPPISSKDIVKKILAVYGTSRNSLTQPTLLDSTNELPDFNHNYWDFQYIDNCLDAIQEVLRQSDLSVPAGGGGDRFGVVFEDVDGDLNIMRIKFVSQGSVGEGTHTITPHDIYNPVSVISGAKDPETGTVVIARGRPGSGGMPTSGDKYRARLEFYERTQPYDSTKAYRKGAYVAHGANTTNPELETGQVYQALRDVTNVRPPSSADWKTVSAFEYIGNIQYSPFTIDKAALYRNECTNPEAAFNYNSNDSPKMCDCNIFINDAETNRDWVYIRQKTNNVSDWTNNQKSYLWNNASLYNGFKILIDTSNLGTGEGAFSPTLDAFGTGAGKDPNGKTYANNHAVYVNGTWYVIKEHEDFDQILVRNEGIYEWNVNFTTGSKYPASDRNNAARRYRRQNAGTPDGWRTIKGEFLANDCLHSPSSIRNVDGLIHGILTQGGEKYTTDSAVEIVYEYGSSTHLPEWLDIMNKIAGFSSAAAGFLGTFAINALVDTYNLFLTPQYTNAGWWITWTFPFPFSTHNSISEKVGELYGGQTLAEINNHPYFDKYNQRVALSGDAGWNETDSDNLMEITGATFLFKLDITANGVTIPFTGSIPAAFWAIDDNGTLWKSKDQYRFLKDVQRFTFDFGNFTPVYRARTPYGIDNLITNILVPELEIRERLQPARIKMMGFQIEAAYDEHGRYIPNSIEHIIKPTLFGGMFNPSSIGTSVKFTGTIDYVQWIKTPIAIEDGSSLGQTPNRTMFPEIKDYPNISNVEQLQRAATADWDTEYFKYEQYELVQNDRADLSLQETVFFRNSKLFTTAEQEAANVAVWASGNNYVVTDIRKVGTTIYECIKSHTSSSSNQPPDAEFWKSLGASVPNTKSLVPGEISYSVTNGRNWNRNMTIYKRIPKVIS